MALHVARIYEARDRESTSGYRVLVDRVWPRGISREDAAVDAWLRDVAPSPELRRWFGHDPARFAEFARRYRAELDGNTAVAELRRLLSEHDDVTLLYGARDTEHNQAVVLADYVRG